MKSYIMIKKLLYMSFLSFVTSCTQPISSDESCTVKIKYSNKSGNMPFIDMKIHETPFRFMVDTGADGLVLPTRNLQQVSGGTETKDIHFINPDGTHTPAVRMKPQNATFEHCQQNFSLKRIYSLDFKHSRIGQLDGLINPRQLLNKGTYIDIDFRHNEIRVKPSDSDYSACQINEERWPVAPGYIVSIEAPNGDLIKAVVDTGASRSFISSDYIDHSQPISQEGTIRSMIGARDAIEYENQTLRIEGKVWHNGPLVATNMVLPRRSSAVIGQDLLSNCMLTLCKNSAALSCNTPTK